GAEDHAELAVKFGARELYSGAGSVGGLRTASHRQRSLQALPGDELSVGPALGFVGVEQAGSGPSVQHGCELPGEVVRGLHARVETKAARGRHVVRRVAG